VSAVPNSPAPELVSIEIDGRQLKAPKGSMIIQAADRAGIAIPRFCYHEKLAIAANCRMCLVDVEKAPKPMPACATPVMEGMKVYTQSKRALDSQRNVMEFLLINHPLDCPICDQGGECELQDLAMGYGRSVSRFVERKRVVADEDLGPLVATDMTRCIHCTRCVRFSGEIAGTYELGGIGRGEHLEIGTYIGRAMTSELSGNIVDVCPVGALTNKVFRFRARAWELIARESIGYHDALGSNLWLHTRRGEVLRAVPRDNEAINECWLSDRDRYSHQALEAPDRARAPMIRRDGRLVEVSWDDAITFVADGLRRHAGEGLAALVAPLTSSEEGLLLAQLLRGLGSDHLDHRLRVSDFADAPLPAVFEMPLAAIEKADAILLIGCNARHDQPLLGHRVRKAALRGAEVSAVNPVAWPLTHALAHERIAAPHRMLEELAALVHAADAGTGARAELGSLIARTPILDVHRAIVRTLRERALSVVVLGDFAVQHPQASILRALARLLARALGAAVNELPSGANAHGLAAAGVVPQRGGRDAAAILAQGSEALITWHAGAQDCARPTQLARARSGAKFYLHVGAYACEGVHATAHAVLPIGLAPEIDGSFVNVDGMTQSFAAAARLPGEARPGWRVLRALGERLGLTGFDFHDLTSVRERLAAAPMQSAGASGRLAALPPDPGTALVRIATTPIYRVDAVVRRAQALQGTPLGRSPALRLNLESARALGLSAGEIASVADSEHEVRLPVEIDDTVANGAAWIEAGHAETGALGPTGTVLKISRG
jgi:NADH-quinone oxidoreductase subunit G